MNVDRAKQILEANEQILVTFEGDPVWIDDISDSNGMATVHSQKDGRVMRVEVTRLHEQ